MTLTQLTSAVLILTTKVLFAISLSTKTLLRTAKSLALATAHLAIPKVFAHFAGSSRQYASLNLDLEIRWPGEIRAFFFSDDAIILYMNYKNKLPIFFFLLLFIPTHTRSEVVHNLLDSTYRAPSEWEIKKTNGFHQLSSPEKDLSIYLLILPVQKSPSELVLQAWKKVQTDFSLKIDQQVTPPPTGGWKAMYKFSFATPLKDSRVVAADIGIYQNKAYITLIDTKAATLDKRMAQVSLIAGSWKPSALQDEKLGDRDAITFTKKEAQQLESFLQRAMSDLQIPGVQAALVQNGQIVWE
jgi:hypothetical protein